MHCFSMMFITRVSGVSTSLSSTHRPRGPKNPVAWHSSINTNAPYCSARSQIPTRGATSPSIENTPSVTTSLRRQDYMWKNRAYIIRNATIFWIFNNYNYLKKGTNICIIEFLPLLWNNCGLQLGFNGTVMVLMPGATQTSFPLNNDPRQ